MGLELLILSAGTQDEAVDEPFTFIVLNDPDMYKSILVLVSWYPRLFHSFEESLQSSSFIIFCCCNINPIHIDSNEKFFPLALTVSE